MYSIKSWMVPALLVSFLTAHGQTGSYKNRKLFLNEDGSQYLKFTMVAQTWLRQTDLNPGSTNFGYAQDGSTDIGIRRLRMQLFGQISDRAFIYTQIGENNFNNNADRKVGFFVHDALGEYALDKKKLSLGMGLSAWNGLARFSSPAVGSILGIDAPLFQQSTNDITDEFLRKLSVYAKGKLGRFDYRLVLAQPMAIQKSNNPVLVTKSGTVSSFSARTPKLQENGYFQYQFWDIEDNTLPYNTGTYLGKKKVLNLGAGFVYQPKAMWKLDTNLKDTLESPMVQLAADLFLDKPMGKKGAALSVYLNSTYFDFGNNYVRNQATMNPVSPIAGTPSPTLNGAGNGYTAFGTGKVMYGQIGYKLKDNLFGSASLMPYVSLQHAWYEKLSVPMDFYDVGTSLLFAGHSCKLTAAYQSRPIFLNNGDYWQRRGAGLLQLQVFFN